MELQDLQPMLPHLAAVSLVLWGITWRLWSSNSRTAPVYGLRYLPRFIRGFMAMVKLGVDEDGFLLDCLRTYGPIVYVPWPMAQYFVLTSPTINRLYATPQKTLSFPPIRMAMQASVFGTSHGVAHAPWMPTDAFPVHAKGLTNLRLDEPIQRFIHAARARVDALRQQVLDSSNGEVTIKLAEWIGDVMFDAALSGIFGPELVRRSESFLPSHRYSLKQGHYVFDESFPLLAAEMVPSFLHRLIPPIREGLAGREAAAQTLAQWSEDGMPGLEEGLIRDVAKVYAECGASSRDIGTLLVSDLWALQANAPQLAAALFTRVLQSPHIIQQLRKEIDDSGILNTEDGLTLKSVNEHLELGSSCVQETLRLDTSSFSIRLAQTDTMFDISNRDESLSGDSSSAVFIPKGARVIAATRAAHLSDSLWGPDPEEWDGERFLLKDVLNEEDRVRLKAKMLKEVRGFGGGVSMCEGRHFATAELKVILTLVLSTFDMQVITPTDEQEKLDKYRPIKLKGVKYGTSFAPKTQDSRPGLGALKFAPGCDVAIRVRLRET
ncbi:hypothetical protein D9758_011454 [Tetrapyrgos nigripes]|uniref:Cytochrome P450 n=1 Tax=Tetrapyrgos nigripes TaxID=182062 RepID=A0A8H5CQV8_9AGAR|nr:hypothetical protein D9758_011454 [Tetrapyrgos nigripes]